MYAALVFLATLTLLPHGAAGQPEPSLRAVVIVNRHSVRTPLSPKDVAAYAAQPWPTWREQPGLLTAHGYDLALLLGRYYRALYTQQGLFRAQGCPDPDTVYLWADTLERTERTARAIGKGLAPGCHVAVHHAAGSSDPLFFPLPRIAKVNEQQARAAMLGAFGGNANALFAAYALPLEQLEQILGCETQRCATFEDAPMHLRTRENGALPDFSGGLMLAASAVDDLELEYTEGKPASETGWGRLNDHTLLDVLPLSHLGFVLDRGAPYASRAEGSNVTAHVLATIDQAAYGTSLLHVRVPRHARFVDFVGHDTTLFEIGTILRLHWLVPGYVRDDLPPDSALVFEVWNRKGAAAFVRTYFIAQSLDQLRNATPLTLSHPPLRVPVFVPGCPGYDCPLSTFDSIVERSIDHRFVGQW